MQSKYTMDSSEYESFAQNSEIPSEDIQTLSVDDASVMCKDNYDSEGKIEILEHTEALLNGGSPKNKSNSQERVSVNVDDNEDNIIRKKFKRFKQIIDSGSEGEDDSVPHLEVDNTELRIDNSQKERIKKSFKISDSEDNQITNNVTERLKAIVDSDSEDEHLQSENMDQNYSAKERKKKSSKILDSDSEDNISYNIKESNQSTTEKPTSNNIMERLKALADSDSEDENVQSENMDQNSSKERKKKSSKILDSDSEDNIFDNMKESNQSTEIPTSNNIMERLKALADSDSEDENLQRENMDQNYSNGDQDGWVEKRSDSSEKSSSKVMSGREAMEQRRQIKSENQRMVRESRISLPYHKPKSHTLQEFLNRRTRLSDVIPDLNIPKALAIKMTAEQLHVTSERLKEREKEIEEFYKSDESDTETDNNTQSKSNDNKAEEAIESEKIENVEIALIQDVLCDSNVTPIVEMDIRESDGIDEQQEENKENKLEDLTLKYRDSPIVTPQNAKNVEEIIKFDKSQNVKINTPLDIKVETEKKVKLQNPLVSLKSTFQPCLSGGPNDMITLDDDLSKSKGVNDLMKRFLAHTSAKAQRKPDEVRILNFDGGKVHVETHKVVLEDDEDTSKHLQKPGAKLQKLREELEEQMAKKRYEHWIQRQKEKEENNDENYVGEKSNQVESDLLEIDEEEEMTESESSESESEDEDIYKEPRVKSAFIEDEADESDQITSNDEHSSQKSNDSFSQTSRNDDQIPLCQPQNINEKTPCRQSNYENDDLAFLTPTIQLSALKRRPSLTKSVQESPPLMFSHLDEPSPLRNQCKAKLFEDAESVQEDNFDELEALCSGQFINTNTQLNKENSSTNFLNRSKLNFDSSQSNSEKDKGNYDDSEENMRLVLEEDSNDFDRDHFQNYFSNKNEQEQSENIKTTNSYMKLVSSDEEDLDTNSHTKKKKRKLILSDDENSDKSSDEDVDQDDVDQEDIDQEEVEETIRNVDYDSEENEIILDKAESNVYKPRDFFEDEAELSESDWDSADEDEKDLDKMEMEEGDAEKFNEKKVQQELERIHMRELLDEDKREIRILQEMLLEDGELHGAGREKKFRWKNADLNAWNDVGTPNEENEDVEEIENELQWRKERHEREKFLEEQRLKENKTVLDEIISAADKSQLTKLGQAALIKSDCTAQENSLNLSDMEILKPSISSNKRGSFLARSENTLTRLAEITKTANNQMNGPKNSRNFVFTSVVKTDTTVDEDKKRKASETTQKTPKKFKVMDVNSRNRNKQKKKSTT